MSAPADSHTCLVSGIGGYLGGAVARLFRSRGWTVKGLTREPAPGSGDVRFQLGESVSPDALAGASALIHCAYDFKPLRWPDIHRVNVEGTARLFEAARQAGVKRMVHVSSISAFEGCRSLYGKAKLETEVMAADFGAFVIRPGLIYGLPPAGMYGRLVTQVQSARFLPLFGGGSQIQYLVHDEDLCGFICACADGGIKQPNKAITVANPQRWTFRQILEEIARGMNKKISFLPVPWRLVWAAIKTGEACHVPLNFRSDSLVSLMYQNPNPSFELQNGMGVNFRPFKFSRA
jgi:nucleoside-diphosphate-sugar epimerase